MKVFKLLLVASSIIYLLGCEKEQNEIVDPLSKKVKDYNSEISYSYNTLYLSIVKHSDGYRPPISSRALAYIGLAVYESTAPGMTKYQSIKSNFPNLILPKINQNLRYHWGVVANTSNYYAMKYFMQVMDRKDNETNDTIFETFNAKFATECDTATFNRSTKFAQEVVYSVYLFSLEDGQANAYRNNKPTDYQPPIGLGLWQSTPPDFLRALTPKWGAVRTFFIKPQEVTFKDPLTYSEDKSSEFYKQAKEVFDAVNNTTTDSKWIAEFWSDDLNSYTIDAAGRWINIIINYIKENDIDLETAIYINAKLGIGMHDVSVVSWFEKYKYNVLRPVTYINKNMDKSWKTILRDPTKPEGQQIGVTPQHPSYPSGHSVYGALAAEIFIKTFGDKIKFTDRTHEKETYFDGRPRTFTSFTQMAEENAYSRIPLGVHYRMDCIEGLRVGNIVGKRINAVRWEL